MKNNSFGGYSTINSYVKSKLRRLDSMPVGFESLFSIMFSEADNIMYEKLSGYSIEKTSYRESQSRILRRACKLKSLLPDAPHNSVIGLYMQNSLDWIEIFWAILCCGFCPLLMNLRLDKASLEYSLSSLSAAAVISDAENFSVPCYSAEDIISDISLNVETFGDKVIVMSSGSSSNLKLCSYTAEEFAYLIKDSYEIIKACPIVKKHYDGQLKLLTFLPFYHIFGLIAVYIWFAFFARTFVHLPDLAPQTILGTIRRHKVTHIFAVPLFWEKVYDEAMRTISSRGEDTLSRFNKGMRIAAKLGNIPCLGKLFSRVAFREVRENLFGESISFMITGGSEIKTQVLAFFNGIGYPLANGYGMTEIGISSVELSSKYSVRSAGFVGKPLSSVEYMISDNSELLVRGKSLAQYIIEGSNTKLRTDEWFHTGDIAECVNGHYRILGRADDLIVGASGENLNPNLIEPKLNFDYKFCLIKNTVGEAVLLISVGKRRTASELMAIKVSAHEQLSRLGLSAQIANIYLCTDDIIGENEFKLNRMRLSKAFSDGLLEEATASEEDISAPDDSLYSRVVELFCSALDKPADAIKPNTDFFLDGGGSSLDYFVLMGRLREEFGISIPDNGNADLSTPSAIYELIRKGE